MVYIVDLIHYLSATYGGICYYFQQDLFNIFVDHLSNFHDQRTHAKLFVCGRLIVIEFNQSVLM